MNDCVVCDSRLIVGWTDRHGEAECLRCGTPYAIAGYNDRSETVCSIKEEALPFLRAYWQEMGEPNALGTYLGRSERQVQQIRAFNAWCDAHPELAPAS